MTRLLAGLIFVLAGSAQAVEPLERIGRLATPEIREASGMVASRRHPGIFWVHNDSKNAPELFAVKRDGQLVRSYKVAALNVDWEDIATDDSGHLFLGDIGNNDLRLPVRVIHQIAEPDPNVVPKSSNPLPVLTSNFYGFPAGGRFDAEGLAVWGNEVLIVTKRRDGQPAEVFRLPVSPVAPLLRPSIPFRVGFLPNCNEPVTGATITRDGRLLAVVTDRSVRVFETDFTTGWVPIGSTSFEAPNIEAITWDGLDLILASEDRSIYRVHQERWRATRGASR